MELARLLLFLLLLFSFLEFQGRPSEKITEAVTGFLLERFLRYSWGVWGEFLLAEAHRVGGGAHGGGGLPRPRQLCTWCGRLKIGQAEGILAAARTEAATEATRAKRILVRSRVKACRETTSERVTVTKSIFLDRFRVLIIVILDSANCRKGVAWLTFKRIRGWTEWIRSKNLTVWRPKRVTIFGKRVCISIVIVLKWIFVKVKSWVTTFSITKGVLRRYLLRIVSFKSLIIECTVIETTGPPAKQKCINLMPFRVFCNLPGLTLTKILATVTCRKFI